MRDAVVERAQFLKRDKRRFVASNPMVCEICGYRYSDIKGLRRHKLKAHAMGPLSSLFPTPKK